MVMTSRTKTDIFSVSGKKVLVTGAARGNGKAIADGFADAGASVFYLDATSDVINNINVLNDSNHQAYQVDITEIDQLRSTLDVIGDIDVLVNNAGITLSQDSSPDHWEKTLSVNLSAAYNLCQLVRDGMIRRGGGSIINITSISAHMGSSGNPSYHASKGGLRYMSKGLAADLGQFNIRVNCICPGYINTNMTKFSFNDEERHKNIKSRTMLNRWGESSDLIGTSIFLASDASSYITGSDIMVDGGLVNKGF